MDLTTEIATVRGELARADGKAATLLGVAGTAVTVAAALAALNIRHLPFLTQWATWSGIGLLSCAVAMLLLAVRPVLPRRGQGGGWITYADTTADHLKRRTNADIAHDQAAELVALARLTRSKFHAIRAAVHMLLGALIAGIVVLLSWVGGA